MMATIVAIIVVTIVATRVLAMAKYRVEVAFNWGRAIF